MTDNRVQDNGAGTMTGLRVVLADDDVLLREGLASLLQRSGFEVVGQVEDGPRLLSMVGETAPDLVIVDVRMPPTHSMEGLDAARAIRQDHPDTAIPGAVRARRGRSAGAARSCTSR